MTIRYVWARVPSLLLFIACIAASSRATAAPGSYSPYVDDTTPRRVYWGDTHLHTSWSVDAAVLGRTTLTPDTAYRFARGEQVTATNGMQVKLKEPLDFLVISDHAEYLGLMQQINRQDPLLMETSQGARWHGMFQEGQDSIRKALFEILMGLAQPDKIGSTELRRKTWEQVTANADQYNEPGVFTAFIGYEWTSSMNNADNMHRNVIFRDSARLADKMLPFTAQDSQDPEALWGFLERYTQATGGQVMAIPHNGNLSNGMMFSDKRVDVSAFDRSYAQRRARWEPLYEVTQIKGDGESHPLLSPNDEFANYENWDLGNLAGERKEPWMLRYEYARSALKLGLAHEKKLGVNPFRFGMIGSTDSHTGLATAAEDNFWGKFSKYEPGNDRLTPSVLPPAKDPELNVLGWQSVASGYAAVWATDNTREAIFDAMQRKEVFATTGPRISVRFFGGFEYKADDALRPDYARVGYSRGVPMGGDLGNAPANRSPRFLVAANKDPFGANLDRIQIVKGWLDSDGELHENVYNVAVSDERPVVDNVVEPVGDTVDVSTASYANSIGEPQLLTRWIDPDFNPAQHAFYYARVLEIPTPRWTAYDAKYASTDVVQGIPMKTQERAYTSPIWYSPAEQSTR
ncbi:DUF3604 domain-containing protein [Pseudohalioglobus lutimaris]|uniref:DUF3604 domain-containing protein n=1 Tax=Pseudohalioglobus lutimaris TaxID=1737061 RepID=A0A2N5WYX3_9GAMM|nr:DUF3604 domain-containing protein [Pseudohalioglobus lutimaris]PLW67419.1 hypothetical protein C0039_16895 [Pseudohalioglobus lutimaris]